MPAHPEWGRLRMSLSQGLILAGDGYQNINIHLVRYPGCNSTDETAQVPRNSQREKEGKKPSAYATMSSTDTSFELYDLRVEIVCPEGQRIMCGAKEGDYFTLKGEMMYLPQDQGISIYSLCQFPGLFSVFGQLID